MKRKLILLVSLMGIGLSYASPALALKGNPTDSASVYRLQDWIATLHVTARAGDGYVAGPTGIRSTYEDYQAAYHSAWQGGYSPEGVILSCGRRCGGDTRIFGFYAERPNGYLDYAIFCKCENLVNWFSEPPWPSGYYLPPRRR